MRDKYRFRGKFIFTVYLPKLRRTTSSPNTVTYHSIRNPDSDGSWSHKTPDMILSDINALLGAAGAHKLVEPSLLRFMGPIHPISRLIQWDGA